MFEEVTVNRLAYRHKKAANLHPADAALNLPVERYSHGLRRLAAIEASRVSFDDTVEAIDRATGGHVPKRQVEQLTQRAAADFDAFNAGRPRDDAAPDDVLVISADGKGIVMLPDALRKATADKAARTNPSSRPDCPKARKPTASAWPSSAPSTTSLPPLAPRRHPVRHRRRSPPAWPGGRQQVAHRQLVADAATVVSQVFDEAERRDPDHRRSWVALVDGDNHRIDRIRAEAERRHIEVAIVCDLVHVLEYLWEAAWCFFSEGDPDAEAWVHDKARAVLEGKVRHVAAAVRRTATNRGLTQSCRANAGTCADYLIRKPRYLDYPTALTNGWPVATGVIEGACRHLVKDRIDLTGAPWGLDGAEAVLKLRALHTNGDLDEYLNFHLAQEKRRVHQSRYAGAVIPLAA